MAEELMDAPENMENQQATVDQSVMQNTLQNVAVDESLTPTINWQDNFANRTNFITDNTSGISPNVTPSQVKKDLNSPDPPKGAVRAILDKGVAQINNISDMGSYAEPYAYDASPKGTFRAKYKAYGQETFNKIGFHPLIDNETWFNQNTTFGDDIVKWATNSAWPMLSKGFMDPIRSYKSIIDGNGLFYADEQSARDYEYYNAIGASTKGGLGGFTVNLLNSASYSMGILAEGATEGALIGFLAGGGTKGVIEGGSSFLRKLGSLPKALIQTGQATRTLMQDVKNYSNISKAKQLFNSAAKNYGNFLNPLQNTTQAFNQIKNTDNITNLARSVTTAGALWHDVMAMNMGLSEGKLEGGFTRNQIYDRLYNDHLLKKGTPPTLEEQESFQRQASKGAWWNTLNNTALIYYSNKLVFPSITNASFLKGLPKFGFGKVVTNVGKEFQILFEPGAKALEGAFAKQKISFANALKSLVKPATYGKVGLNYFKANVVEGFQEVFQDILQDSTEKYYVNTFYNPDSRNFRYGTGLLGDAINKQWSAQGLETFLSGFLMGTILQAPGKIKSYATVGYNDYLKKDANYQEYLTGREKLADDVVNELNTMYKNGHFFLDPRIDNYANQALIANVVDNPDEHTTKEIRDAEFTGFQSAVISSLQNGTFDMFLQHYKNYKQASPEDIEQAWNLAPGQGLKALERFDKSLKNAEQIRDRWNTAKNSMKYQANLDDYEKDSEEYHLAEVYNKAYNQSLYNYVFLHNSFDNNVERLDKIYNELSKISVFKNTLFSSAVNLTDPTRLIQEIEMLKTEVENLESFASSSSLEEASKKRELIELYSKFSESQENLVELFVYKSFLSNIKAEIEKEDPNLTDNQVTVKAIDKVIDQYEKGNSNEFMEYKQAFSDLLFGLANTQEKRMQLEKELQSNGGIDSLFDSLLDTHILKNENASLLNYVNILSNPREFYEHLMRNYAFMKDLYNNKEEIAKNIVNQEISAIENNTLLNTLADEGYYIDLDAFAEWVENKKLPEEFIDARNKRIVNKGSVLYEDLIKMFRRAAMLAEKKPAGEPLSQKQVLDKRIENFEKDRASALAEEKEKYEQKFKDTYGLTIAEYQAQESTRILSEELSESERKEFEKEKELLTKAIEKLASNDYVEVLAAAEVIAESLEKQNIDAINFFDAQTEVQKNDRNKNKNIFELSQKYDTSDIDDQQESFNTKIDAALKSVIYSEYSTQRLATIENELSKKASKPSIDIENTREYLEYKESVDAIETKYDNLIADVKEEFKQKGVDENTQEAYTNQTKFEDFDSKFQDEITELFDLYLQDVLLEPLTIKETNPIDYERFRTNWLERQTDLINKFNAESKLNAQERNRKLAGVPELKFVTAKIDGTTPTWNIAGIIKTLNRYLKDGEYPDIKNKGKTIQLTPELIADINDDIAALNGYLNARVDMAEPRDIAEETINLIQENVIKKQDEIVELFDEEGNMIGRTFKDRAPGEPIPERTTQVAEEIETTLLNKDPFEYQALKDLVDENGNVTPSPVENLFNQFFADPEIQNVDKIRLFMDAFKRKAYQAGKGGWKQFRWQEKLDAIQNSLETVGTIEHLKRTVEKYAFKESSDAGDYVDSLIRIFLTPNAGTKSNFSEIEHTSEVEIKGRMMKVSDMMSKKVFDKLFAPVSATNPGGFVTKFRLGIIDGTYTILSENVKLFDKSLRDGRGVTGEIDLLLIREDGSVAIVDIKTSTEYKWKDFGKGTDYDKSTYFRAQQSIYGTMFYNNTAITPDLKLMPFSVTLSEDKVGYIEDIELASIVPEGQDTIDLEYLPDIADYGIIKITPEIKAPVRTATTEIRIVESTIKKNAVEFKIKSKKDNTVIREFIIYKKGEIIIIEPIQGSTAKTLDISETEKEDLLKQFISQESLDLVYQHRDSPSDKTIESSLQQSLNKDAASATSRLSRPTDTKADVERRKEEAKASISKIEDNLWNANYPINLERTIFDTLEGETKKEIQNKINAKYDAELAALTDTKADVNGIPESDPTLNTLKDNIDKAVIYNGRVGKLVRMPDGNFGVEVTINNDITVLQLTLDALEANLLVEKSEFGNTDTIDELNKNIERISAAIKSSKGVTQIFPVQINGKTVSNDLLKLADAGISLVIKTESIGQVSTINGEIVDVSFSNKEETIASINGIRYDIIRDKSGSITALTYMSNSKEISLLDDEINKINKNIDTLRNTISDIEKDTENLSSKPSRKIDPIIIRISELQELRDSNLKKRTNLVQTNKKIYVYGENSNNYIFALNRLPNSFQRLTKNATKANEKEDLKSITNLSVSRGIAENITEILSYQYPEALDKLFSGDVESLTTKDLLNIELWLEDSIAKLNELGYSVINRGDLVDDILNQINALNEFRNDLQLIKLTKNGKIYNYKQVGKFFSESKVQERSSVPQNEGSRPESTKRVLGQSTKEDFAELIKRSREQNVDDVFDNTEETSTKNTSEQTDFEIINNSTLNNIEDNFQKEFLRMQKEGLNAKSLHEAYKKRLEELKTIVSLQNVSVSEYLIGNKPIFSNKSEEIVQVIKKTNDTVTVKNILTQETKEFTEAELITNFDKTTMEATQPKPEVTLTDADIQDSVESKDTIKDIIQNESEALEQSKENAKASDKKSRWDKLGDNSKLC
jgi:hypothetical protein